MELSIRLMTEGLKINPIGFFTFFLQQTERGKDVCAALESGAVISDNDRRFMVRELVTDLMANCGQKNKPTVDEKEKLGIAIVTAFPALKYPIDNRPPHVSQKR